MTEGKCRDHLMDRETECLPENIVLNDGGIVPCGNFSQMSGKTMILTEAQDSNQVLKLTVDPGGYESSGFLALDPQVPDICSLVSDSTSHL